MAKGLAEATDMVDGALFDQCKSDKGDEVIAKCGKAGMDRVDPKDWLTTSSPTFRLISHIYTVLSHDSAISEHKTPSNRPFSFSQRLT